MKIYTVGARWEGIEEDDFVTIQQGIGKVEAFRLANKLDPIIDETWDIYVLEIEGANQRAIDFKQSRLKTLGGIEI